MAYNLGEYEKSQKFLARAKTIFPSSSYIFYHSALLDLVNGKPFFAIDNLNKSIGIEDDALTPYLLNAQIAIDEKRLTLAKVIVDKGLDNYDDDNFQLNYMGGLISYKEQRYESAIDYFKEALSNTTINEIEAEVKLWISKCYNKSDDRDEGKKWFQSALKEIDDEDKKQYKKKLIEAYYEN